MWQQTTAENVLHTNGAPEEDMLKLLKTSILKQNNESVWGHKCNLLATNQFVTLWWSHCFWALCLPDIDCDVRNAQNLQVVQFYGFALKCCKDQKLEFLNRQTEICFGEEGRGAQFHVNQFESQAFIRDSFCHFFPDIWFLPRTLISDRLAFSKWREQKQEVQSFVASCHMSLYLSHDDFLFQVKVLFHKSSVGHADFFEFLQNIFTHFWLFPCCCNALISSAWRFTLANWRFHAWQN